MKFKSRSYEQATTILDIRNLSVKLPNQPDIEPILDGISLKIRAGETACLVGESGSGKSVTSLAVMGLLPKGALQVTGGEISLQDRELLGLSNNELRHLRASSMAMIFQEPMTALNPVMKVGDQIEEVLKIHANMSASERKARVLDIMEQVHLPDVRRIHGSYPHQLSGGQRQRIMIAMALVLKPQLLIADEPTTALDVTTQEQILSLISELQEVQGTAVLFVTHDMGVVAEIADTVHVMKEGQIVEQAPVEQLLRQPRNDYTRKLLQAVPSLIPRKIRPPKSDDQVLQVRDMTKIYGGGGFFIQREGTLAAEDVSFSIARGRTLGIVGESGSGKSTVARCVMRLIDPTEGEVRVGGQEIATLNRRQLRPHRRHIQIVFQDPFRSLNPRWKVGRSLVEGPLNYGTSREEAMKQAGDLMELVGLPRDVLDRYPHQFSGGQRQRIAIARAVAMKPDVLVADEAVSALDVSIQAQVLELLGDIQDKLGVAILFITHDLRVAAQICDDIVVMQDGRIVEYNSATEVLANPKHEYTRALTEAAPGREWDFANFCELQKTA
ncbi:ABC transporter ATP-binding protein [Fodinicurvata halophila]|uniref:ABC transporter ATP-binding protein n=2 Tax=Fodinicurvata halophila TaxID=1419723 RepID=A0ABV8UKJ3_9PROT